MFIIVYITCLHVSIYAYIWISILLYMHTLVYMCVLLNTFLCAFQHIHMLHVLRVCMCICIEHTFMHTHIYFHIYIYSETYILTENQKSDPNMGFTVRIAELLYIQDKAIQRSDRKKQQKSAEADSFETGLLRVCIHIMCGNDLYAA